MTKTTSPNISNSNQEKRNVHTSTENGIALLGKQAQISSLTAEVFILTVTSQNNVEELYVLTEIVMVLLLLIFILV